MRAALVEADHGGLSVMFNLVIGFLNDFLIIAGGMVTTAMLAQDVVAVPRLAVILLATLTGLVQAGRRLQAKLDPSPVLQEVWERRSPDLPVRTPEQLMQQIHDNEATAAALIEAVTRAVAKAQPPTPLRVEVSAPAPVPPPPPAPVPKDNFS